MSAPKRTPTMRQAKANWPMSTWAMSPLGARASRSWRSVLGRSGVTSAPMAAGSNGSFASEKTALPLLSIA